MGEGGRGRGTAGCGGLPFAVSVDAVVVVVSALLLFLLFLLSGSAASPPLPHGAAAVASVHLAATTFESATAVAIKLAQYIFGRCLLVIGVTRLRWSAEYARKWVRVGRGEGGRGQCKGKRTDGKSASRIPFMDQKIYLVYFSFSILSYQLFNSDHHCPALRDANSQFM